MNTNGHEGKRTGSLRSRQSRILFICLFAVLLLPLTSQAFFFGKKQKKSEEKKMESSRKYVLRIPDKTAEGELVSLFQQKRIIMGQVLVLEQLKEEKARELAAFNQQLMSAFAMDAEGRYEYDPAGKAIYRVEQATGEKRIHKQLVSGPQSARFASLQAGKQLVMEELRVFVLVSQEKQSEMEGVDKRLLDRFLIRNDRNYQYEPKTMRLFEIVGPKPKPVPPKEEESINLETLFQAPVPMSR